MLLETPVRVIFGAHGLEATAAVRDISGRVAIGQVPGNAEDRILHTQGLEDISAAILIEPHSGEVLDEVCLHVMGEAVDPALPWLVKQRHPGKLANQLIKRVEPMS